MTDSPRYCAIGCYVPVAGASARKEWRVVLVDTVTGLGRAYVWAHAARALGDRYNALPTPPAFWSSSRSRAIGEAALEALAKEDEAP